MRRQFRPYLDIKNETHLRLLLNKQNTIEENLFPLKNYKFLPENISKNEIESVVDKIKSFYGYRAQEKDIEFVDQLLYHFIINNYYLLLYNNNDMQTVTEIIKMPQVYNFLKEEINELNEFINKNFKENVYKFPQIDSKDNPDFNKNIYFQLKKIQVVLYLIGRYRSQFRINAIMNVIYLRTVK